MANPGSMVETPIIAAALENVGALRKYITPFGNANLATAHFTHVPILSRLSRELASQLNRRQLPAVLTKAKVEHVGSLWEGLSVLSRRSSISSGLRGLITSVRNERFDRAVSLRLQKSDDAVVSTYEASLLTFTQARRLGAASYLDYPHAHHKFAEAMRLEEAHLHPDQAKRVERTPIRSMRKLDDELQLADYIFYLCSFQKRTFVESGIDEQKLLYTPPGVDTALFRPQPRSEDGKFRMIFKGHLMQRKGLFYAIEGFSRACIPNSELLLAGSAVEGDNLWRGIPGVTQLPYLQYWWQVPAVYRTADVYVMPSLVEGFLLTGLEAMASGLPVIVSTNTFASDIITDGVDGFIVPIRDADAIAERLRFLYDHPDVRRSIGRRARRRAQQFSWLNYEKSVVKAICGRGASHFEPPRRTPPVPRNNQTVPQSPIGTTSSHSTPP